MKMNKTSVLQKENIEKNSRELILPFSVIFLSIMISACTHAAAVIPASKNLTSEIKPPQKRQAEETASSFIICKNGGHIRTLRVQPQIEDSLGCQAFYSKDGNDQSIATNKDASKCQGIIESVRKNLEQGQWNCRNVKEAKLSNLTPDVETSTTR